MAAADDHSPGRLGPTQSWQAPIALALVLTAPASRAEPTQQSVVAVETLPQSEVVQQTQQTTDVETGPEGIAAETKPSPVELETQRQRVDPDLPSGAMVAEPDAMPVEPPAAARVYSAGRRAEPELWALLHAERYRQLAREIERLRHEDPNWEPPQELLDWLQHHLAKAAAAEVERERVAEVPAAPTQTSPYADAVQRAVRLQKGGRPDAALTALEPWLARIEQRRDAPTMVLVGWLRLDADRPESALAAFQRAGRWRPGADAAKGELLALAALHRIGPLIDQAQTSVMRWPGLREPAADALRSLATRRHRAGDYAPAQRLLDAALALAPAKRETELLSGWNLLALGEPRRAADTFESLYRQEPDTASAEGLLSSLKRLGASDELRWLAQSDGPLRPLWLRDQAEQLVARGELIRAYRTDPNALPALANIDSPSTKLGVRWRERSGDPGMGQLTETIVPVARFTHWSGLVGVELALDRVSLDAGTPRANALIGAGPRATTLDPGALRNASTVSGGLSWTLGIGYQGDWRLAAVLGQTPTGGALGPKLHGRLSVGQRRSHFAWDASLEQEPVRESLLSCTGLADPRTGDAWGGVLRSGLSLQGWHQLGEDWTLAGLLRVHEYRGTDVADNTGLEASLALGRDLRLPSFSYLTLGPALEYRHFRRNLNHFTVGHGGYYSPDRDIGLMLALDFQTREAASWLLRGSARAGWRIQDEAASPWFPLAPTRPDAANGTYPATSETGVSASLALAGVAQLTPHWQLGASLSGNYSRRFQEYSVGAFLRWLFAPRQAVFSADLPGSANLDLR